MEEKKVFKFKGKTLEELKELSINELAELFPSRIRRKIMRGFTEQEKTFLDKLRAGESDLKTHCRGMIVLPEMVGHKISIYNGKSFVPVEISEGMVGLRLGELAPTRKIGAAKGGKKK